MKGQLKWWNCWCWKVTLNSLITLPYWFNIHALIYNLIRLTQGFSVSDDRPSNPHLSVNHALLLNPNLGSDRTKRQRAEKYLQTRILFIVTSTLSFYFISNCIISVCRKIRHKTGAVVYVGLGTYISVCQVILLISFLKAFNCLWIEKHKSNLITKNNHNCWFNDSETEIAIRGRKSHIVTQGNSASGAQQAELHVYYLLLLL